MARLLRRDQEATSAAFTTLRWHQVFFNCWTFNGWNSSTKKQHLQPSLHFVDIKFSSTAEYSTAGLHRGDQEATSTFYSLHQDENYWKKLILLLSKRRQDAIQESCKNKQVARRIARNLKEKNSNTAKNARKNPVDKNWIRVKCVAGKNFRGNWWSDEKIKLPSRICMNTVRKTKH